MKKTRILLFVASIGYWSHAFAGEVVVQEMVTIKLNKPPGLPLIAVAVAGIKTEALLDTSSSHPMLLEAFARKSGLYKEEGQLSIEDAVALEDKPIPFTVGPLDMSLGQTVVVKDVSFNQKQHIGMVYNPNSFQCKHCLVVLDFVNNELYAIRAESDAATKLAVDKRYKGFARATAAYAGNDDGLLYISGVSINRGRPGVALVDTGSHYSLFLRSSVEGDIPVSGKSSVQVKDRQVITEVTAPVPISIGGKEIIRAPIMLEAAPSLASHFMMVNNPEFIQHQGSIGMDILKKCAIAIQAHKAVHFYCTPPA